MITTQNIPKISVEMMGYKDYTPQYTLRFKNARGEIISKKEYDNTMLKIQKDIPDPDSSYTSQIIYGLPVNKYVALSSGARIKVDEGYLRRNKDSWGGELSFMSYKTPLEELKHYTARGINESRFDFHHYIRTDFHQYFPIDIVPKNVLTDISTRLSNPEEIALANEIIKGGMQDVILYVVSGDLGKKYNFNTMIIKSYYDINFAGKNRASLEPVLNALEYVPIKMQHLSYDTDIKKWCQEIKMNTNKINTYLEYWTLHP